MFQRSDWNINFRNTEKSKLLCKFSACWMGLDSLVWVTIFYAVHVNRNWISDKIWLAHTQCASYTRGFDRFEKMHEKSSYMSHIIKYFVFSEISVCCSNVQIRSEVKPLGKCRKKNTKIANRFFMSSSLLYYGSCCWSLACDVIAWRRWRQI